jgi:ligand-binding sensor domain-containing protein/signal transduction histidine kinase
MTMLRIVRAACAAAATIALFASVAPSAFALTPDRELTQYVHRIWQTQQGLPDGAITRIIQDRQGYLWIATENGLYRFDGVRFTPVERLYTGAPAGLFIRAAALDSSGTFWLGGNDGAIYAVRADQTTKFTSNDGLPGGQIQCMLAARNGIIWACMERGLVRIDPGDRSVKVFRASEGLASDNSRTICEDPKGNIWAGGDTPNLALYNNGSFRARRLNHLPEVASVRTLLCDDDTIWAGTSFGLVRLQDNQQQLFTSAQGLVDSFVFDVQRGDHGIIWVGTRSGFSRLRDGATTTPTWDSFLPRDGLSQSTAQALLEDREGSLWVGTKRGLNQFVNGRSVPYTASEGLPSNETGPILQDSQGVIWAGTLDAGLAHFDGRRFLKMNTRDGLPSNVIRTLEEDADHSLWVGTENGLARVVSGRVVARYHESDGLPSADIRALFRSKDGSMWVGTSKGLATYSHGQWSIPLGMPHVPIRCIGQDRDGNIVVGVEEGLYIMNGHAFEPLAQGEMYLRNPNAFLLDQYGLLWVAMNGAGLRIIDGRHLTQLTTRDGLYDAEILGLALDSQDRLWMACSRGIFRVDRDELVQYAGGEIDHVSSVPYTPTDAQRVIEGRAGVSPAMWRMNDGHLWLSTARGLLALDTAAHDEPDPPVVIENPLVNGASTPPAQISKLPGGQKNIQFTFAGLSYLQPELIQYRYRLQGYAKDWVDAGTRTEVSYTNLPPGDYTFDVTACNFDEPCNSPPTSVSFSLAPLIYQRALFWPLCILIGAALGWLGYQLHIRRLQERYDLIVSERSRIARELHDTLIQGFSGITMALQALSTRIRTPAERETIEDIISDAATCLRETRQSVAGLRAVEGPESGLVNSIKRAVREITETKPIRVKLSLENFNRELPPDTEYNLLRIIREAVNNSVKHSGAGLIEVSLQSSPGLLVISIHDDGSGFSSDDAAALGPGHYGLIGMKERASQIGAEFEVVTNPGAGTTISVSLPIFAAAPRTLELSK